MSAAARRKADQLEQDKRDADLRAVLATQAGRRLVWRLLNICKVFGDSFDSDTHLHARNAGMRSVGLKLMEEAQRVAPQSYLEMTGERINASLLELTANRNEKDAAAPENESSHE